MVSEEERERATVYMQGMAEMRKQWAPKPGQKAKRDHSK